MRNFLKRITHPFLKFGLHWYYSKPRKYSYENCMVWVHPEVFPPHLTFSTRLLLDFIGLKELKNKSLLELGCGSGIISVYGAKKGATVMATDINQKALDYLEKSAKENKVEIAIVKSDLFEKIPKSSFDFIIINPPYYPKNPTTIKDMGWFCGEHFEYFEKLFAQLPSYITSENEIFMILSEDCNIEQIKTIALQNKITFKLVLEKSVYTEKNYIFQLQLLG